MNTLIEKAADDSEIHQLLNDSLEKMKDVIADQILRGQKSGEFRTDKDPNELVAVLMLHASGLYVAMRGNIPFLRKQNSTELILELLKK